MQEMYLSHRNKIKKLIKHVLTVIKHVLKDFNNLHKHKMAKKSVPFAI